MGKGPRTKHRGVKNSVICILMLKAQSAVSKVESDWDDFFRGKYREFWSNPSNVSTPVRIAPSDAEIREFSFDSELRQRCSSNMSTHEFVRKVRILVENKGSRSALINSGIDLIRIEQQRRMVRDEFW